jgi:hypothetical protein
MSEDKTGFTVLDSRHFDAEGRPRVSDADAPASEPAMAEVNVDFPSFLVSLAAQASALMLGRQAAGGESAASVPPDLEGARRVISILEMLEDKTRGRRTDEESRLLDGLLFQLRLEYVRQREEGAR